MGEELLKGPAAEEALRSYFTSIGYFVVRGCKFRFAQFDVTDVDLWLYGRRSALSRERIIVDIKRKKTPQALERIFWTKGLQKILGVDGCIVATTDKRVEVRSFGLKHNVNVIDGLFMERLLKSERSVQQRISEEQLLDEIRADPLSKLVGDYFSRYEASKTRLLDSLTFDGCNAWANEIGVLLQEAIQLSSSEHYLWRLVYLSTAYFLIAVDFVLQEHWTATQEEKRALLEGGFRYGSAGKSYMDKVAALAASLATSFIAHPVQRHEVRAALDEEALAIKADVLAEFLAKGRHPSMLFDLAREFESAAYSVSIPLPRELSASCQAMLGVLSDFHGLDRKRVLV